MYANLAIRLSKPKEGCGDFGDELGAAWIIRVAFGIYNEENEAVTNAIEYVDKKQNIVLM